VNFIERTGHIREAGPALNLPAGGGQVKLITSKARRQAIEFAV